MLPPPPPNLDAQHRAASEDRKHTASQAATHTSQFFGAPTFPSILPLINFSSQGMQLPHIPMTSTPLQDEDWATVEPMTDEEEHITPGQHTRATQQTAVTAVEMTESSETPVGTVIEILDSPATTSTGSQEIVPPRLHISGALHRFGLHQHDYELRLFI